MHKITIFPLGNADTTRIDLEGGEKLLIDYANVGNADNEDDNRIDLSSVLREDLEETDRLDYDVVAFTHLDHDHVSGASNFFHFRHADKYQGGDRVKMKMMWVPAALILEQNVDGDSRVIRQEARHRLKKGQDIRVFSSPGRLDDWLKKKGINPESRNDLFVDAGNLVPDFDLAEDGIEIFAHSPHASRSEEGELIDRNNDALAFQCTFKIGNQKTRMHFFSDLSYEVIKDIVRITEYHDNNKRLEWDLFHLPHHCSYTALAEDKGEEKTQPKPRVERLYKKYGNNMARMISTSQPIPTEDTDMPPHRQAAEFYKSVADKHDGEYIVTMEFPSQDDPKPTVIEIDEHGPTLEKSIGLATGGGTAASSPTPRAGR